MASTSPAVIFYHAKKGARAFGAWTSLLVGRDVFVNNGVWFVGDGELVWVFGDS